MTEAMSARYKMRCKKLNSIMIRASIHVIEGQAAERAHVLTRTFDTKSTTETPSFSTVITTVDDEGPLDNPITCPRDSVSAACSSCTGMLNSDT